MLVASCGQQTYDCRGQVEDGVLVRANVCIVNGPVQPYDGDYPPRPVVITVPRALAPSELRRYL